MKKQDQFASALSLILSIGFVGHLYAGSTSTSPPLSENCRRASTTRDSLVTSVHKILCDQEHADELAFGSFIKRETPTNPGEKPLPKQPPIENHPSIEPKGRVKANTDKMHNLGVDHFPATDKPNSKNVATDKAKRQENHRGHFLATTPLRLQDFFIGKTCAQLSRSERSVLRRRLESLLKRTEVRALLIAIQRAEGGARLRVVGGTRGKSADCKRRIGKLTARSHPKEQGLPNRCFLRTRKYGLSTAAGSYQIVYYRNWKSLRKLLDLPDFSEKSQAIAALEIMRTSAVRGSKVGDGFVALVKGDLDNAIRKGTDPWASSPYSRWRGKRSRPLLQYARQELKKLRNQDSYALSQLKRFRHDSNS